MLAVGLGDCMWRANAECHVGAASALQQRRQLAEHFERVLHVQLLGGERRDVDGELLALLVAHPAQDHGAVAGIREQLAARGHNFARVAAVELQHRELRQFVGAALSRSQHVVPQRHQQFGGDVARELLFAGQREQMQDAGFVGKP